MKGVHILIRLIDDNDGDGVVDVDGDSDDDNDDDDDDYDTIELITLPAIDHLSIARNDAW